MKGLGLRKLGTNIAATLGRQLGAGALQLITLAVIARVYGPEGNGAYTVALLLPTMLATLLNLGIAPANVYYLGSGKVGPAEAWRSTMKFFVVIVAVGMLMGGLAIGLFAEQWFPGVPPLLLGFALTVFPVALLQGLITSIFQGLQQFRQFNLVLLLQPFLTLLGIVALVLAGIENIGWLLAAYLIASMVTVALAIYVLRPFLKNEKEPAFPHYGRAAIRYGYKAHLSNILAFVNYKADIFLVNFFIGPVGAGVYVIAVQLAERLWMLSQAVSTVLLPRLSELSNEEDKRKQLTPLITRWVLWITLLGSVALAVVAYPLIPLIFGIEFSGAYVALLILLPGIVAGSASRVLANDIAARGRPELNMYTSFVVVAVNIAANIILIPAYGINGAAAATSIAYLINLILRLAMHRYFTLVPIRENLLISRADFIQVCKVCRK